MGHTLLFFPIHCSAGHAAARGPKFRFQLFQLASNRAFLGRAVISFAMAFIIAYRSDGSLSVSYCDPYSHSHSGLHLPSHSKAIWKEEVRSFLSFPCELLDEDSEPLVLSIECERRGQEREDVMRITVSGGQLLGQEEMGNADNCLCEMQQLSR